MKSFIVKATGIVALLAIGIGAAVTANASQVTVNIAEPAPALVGQPSQIDATLTAPDTGKPMAGVSVTFLAHSSFGKVDGFMEIGRGVTNSDGIAAISYVPRDAGHTDVKVDYVPAAGGKMEEAVGAIDVQGGASQLYVQKSGIQVPGLSSWLIVGLLTIIWGTLFGVALMVVRIARAGQGEARVARRETVSVPAGSATSLSSGG
jgi:hypothetical protein